jgi:hypothetical protein
MHRFWAHPPTVLFFKRFPFKVPFPEVILKYLTLFGGSGKLPFETTQMSKSPVLNSSMVLLKVMIIVSLTELN